MAVRERADRTTGAAQGLMSSQRWRRLVPLAFITYSFAYLDRSNYSLGSAGGLTDALHINSGQAGLLGGMFFAGYFIFQVPAAVFAERRSVKKLMFWSLILWGILAALQGLIDSYGLLLVDRFALGVVEAAVIPAMLVFLTHWFISRERGRANTFLILGNPVTLMWMSVVSGYLISATSYRWMFVIEGLPAVAWAFVFRSLVDDHPGDAAWLEDAERQEIENRLEAEQAHVPSAGGILDALRSRNVIVLGVQYLVWSIGVYGFVFWLPTIVKSLSGRGIGSVGLLSAIPYALATILMITNSYVSDRTNKPRRLFVWPFLLIASVAFYLSYAIGTGHGGTSPFLVSFVLLVIAGGVMNAPYGPYFAYVSELLPQEVSGAAMGAINALGAVGGFTGTYIVGALGGGTKSGAAFFFLAVTLLVAALLMFLVRQPRTSDAASPAGLRSGLPRRARSAERQMRG